MQPVRGINIGQNLLQNLEVALSSQRSPSVSKSDNGSMDRVIIGRACVVYTMVAHVVYSVAARVVRGGTGSAALHANIIKGSKVTRASVSRLLVRCARARARESGT